MVLPIFFWKLSEYGLLERIFFCIEYRILGQQVRKTIGLLDIRYKKKERLPSSVVLTVSLTCCGVCNSTDSIFVLELGEQILLLSKVVGFHIYNIHFSQNSFPWKVTVSFHNILLESELYYLYQRWPFWYGNSNVLDTTNF
jgi:hypothetical protein